MNFLAYHATSDVPGEYDIEINFRVQQFAFLQRILGSFPDEIFASVRSRIKFADYIIAQQIQSVVDGWIDALPTVKPVPGGNTVLILTDLIERYSYKASSLAISAAAFIYLVDSSEDFFTLKNLSLFVAFLIVFYLSIGFLVGATREYLRSIATQIRPHLFILFTNGDRRMMQNVIEKSKRLVSRANYAIYAVPAAILLNLLSATIWEYAGRPVFE